MTNVNKVIFLTISLSSVALAQLPFFLQRFRPVKHGLLSSGSTSYPSFASSLFPLSSSSSLLSSAYTPHNSFLGNSGHGSSPFSSSPGLGSLNFASSPFTASASSLSPFHFGNPSFSSSNFGSSFLATPSFSSPSFSNSHLNSHRQYASNLGHSLVDLGSVGGYNEGLGGYDQTELIDDYPGFSNAGFAKELNFAGSHTVKLQSPSANPYNNADLASYYQRSADEKK